MCNIIEKNKIKDIIQQIETKKKTKYISENKNGSYEFENTMPKNIGNHLNDESTLKDDINSIKDFSRKLMDGLE